MVRKGYKKGTMRKLCSKCQTRPVAVNYYKEGRAYYRSKCDHCSRGHKEEKPLWALYGYKKKSVCEKCSYTSKHEEQFNVFHVDGNLTNNRLTNLKTVCANCQRILHKEGVRWRQGDLRPDHF
jgi:hypothetical protein